MSKITMSSVIQGDVFVSNPVIYYGRRYVYHSTVVHVGEMTTRFGKPDRILTVDIVTSDDSKTLVDFQKCIWFSQLEQGLV